MREAINAAIKVAMKSGDKRRLATLRLVNAAIKDRDLAAGIDDKGQTTGRDRISDADILTLMQKMVKQRRESIDIYTKAGRDDLAERELEEIAVIEGYLPQQMSAAEQEAAVSAAIKELNAAGLKDMGRVMGLLKERYQGRMDFAKASGVVKEKLK